MNLRLPTAINITEISSITDRNCHINEPLSASKRDPVQNNSLRNIIRNARILQIHLPLIGRLKTWGRFDQEHLIRIFNIATKLYLLKVFTKPSIHTKTQYTFPSDGCDFCY